jgi:hypothetical protein
VAITSVGDLANSWTNNKVFQSNWFKTANPTPNFNGHWLDLSMAAGTPKFNPYVGNALEFTPLVGSGNNGINAGLGGDGYLVRYRASGSNTSSHIAPGNFMLMDYVGFYPLVDMDFTDLQVFDNTNYASRYTSGLRLMVVTTIPQSVSGVAEVKVTYTDSNNVQTSVSFWVTAISSIGTINCLTSNGYFDRTLGPFVPLGPGTIDVKQVDSITMLSPAGGFCAFVLVKPIYETTVYSANTPVELEFPRNKVPAFVPSGAYLNHIVGTVQTTSASGSTTGVICFARE